MTPFFKSFLAFVIALLLDWCLAGLFITIASTQCAHADDNPYRESTPKMEWAYQAALAADCSTTFDIKNHYGTIDEANPILGKHPSDARITEACVGSSLLHYGLTRVFVDHDFSPKFISAWEWVTTAIEVGVSAHNYSIGLRFKLPSYGGGNGEKTLAPATVN